MLFISVGSQDTAVTSAALSFYHDFFPLPLSLVRTRPLPLRLVGGVFMLVLALSRTCGRTGSSHALHF